MSFDISVHKRADDDLFTCPPEGAWSKEFYAWMALCHSRTFYNNPLGSGSTIYHYWSTPAAELTLPLIASIYDSGLRLTGAELDRLAAELDVLEQHWGSLDFTAEPNIVESTMHDDGTEERNEIPFYDHLRERMGYLREAIQIARDEDGVLTVS